MAFLFNVQTGLVTALALLTVWCRILPTAGAFHVAFYVRDAVIAGALLHVVILLVRCMRRRSLVRGFAPIGSNAALLLAAVLASAWFWGVLAVVAAST